MTYTPVGPWTNGAPPGADQNFFNNLETFLQSVNSAATDSHITSDGNGVMTLLGLVMNGGIQSNPTAHLINGSTSGTATLYQILTGTCKLFYIIQNNFRNGSAGSQFIAFPTAISTTCFLMSGDTGSFNLTSSGSAITVRQFSSFGALSNITNAGTAMLGQAGICDSIAFLGSQSSAHSGPILIFGV